MPFRGAFGSEEERVLQEAIRYYRDNQIDPPYDGEYETQFCNGFVEFMQGGYADAVASGTISCYIAVAALNLPKGSDVLISPVTDSGPLNAIIMLGLNPVLMDSAPNSYNIDIATFLERVTPNTSGVFLVHSAGEPVNTEEIVKETHNRGIRVIEDCSQAPGAVVCKNSSDSCDRSCNVWTRRRVGTFGDIAAFSTMYRKTLTAGASGGLVYSTDQDIYHQAIAYADRGRPKWRKDYNNRNPGDALFPSLNFNTDELSCAIGLGSLSRLQNTIDKRCEFVECLCNLLSAESNICRPYNFHAGFSPFYFPIFVDEDKISCSKSEFSLAVESEGIPLGVHYDCVISSWDYAKKYLKDDFAACNAERVRDTSFNLFLNENYSEREAIDIVTAINKVESYFRR